LLAVNQLGDITSFLQWLKQPRQTKANQTRSGPHVKLAATIFL